ncbi:MAG: hypothetical protein R3A49_06870 [Acidimicrobiia bacterium]
MNGSGDPSPADNTYGARFWVGVVIGGAVMAYGAIGLIRNLSGDALVSWGLFFIGADLLHDSLFAPAAFLAGAVLARLLPVPWRTPVMAGCIISASVLLVVLPPLIGLGGNPGNPTLHPIDYTTSTITALAIVWGAVGAVSLVAARGERRSSSS